MRIVLQEIADEESEVVVYLDGEMKAICTRVHIKARLVHVPTAEAELYHHTFVAPEFLYEPTVFEGVMFTVNIATLSGMVYAQLGDDCWDFGVF